MKIAVYSRKSKFTGKGESIENQILKCQRFIEFKFDKSLDDVEIFIDEGYSGKNENRPEYQKMISKVKSKEIDSIVIYQLNRLGRNARDIHNTMQLCEELGAVIYSATEGFDSSTSFGRAVIGILASLAQLEREQLAERVKDNMYTLAKMGRWLGGQTPLGFDGVKEMYIDESGKQRYTTKLIRNEEELKVATSIYKKYLELKSLSQVNKWALSNHLKGKNGGDFDKTTLNFILQNPTYVKSTPEVLNYLESKGYEVCGNPNGNGILRYGKNDEVIAAVSKHKGVIDADTWLKVQSILKENLEKAPRTGKTNTALLTGILKCSCGSGMRVSYGHVNKDGVRPFYYTCAMKNNSGGTRCKSKNILGNLLESKLIDYLKVYNKQTFITNLEDSLKDLKTIEAELTTEKIDDEISKVNKSINQLLDKLRLVNDDDVAKIILAEIKAEKDKIKSLNDKKEELLNAQSNLVYSQSEILNIIDMLDDFNLKVDSLTLDEKRAELNKLLESIIFTGDEFHLKFKVKKN